MTPSASPALASRQLVVVDVEGNGQQPPEIIEITVLPLGGDTPTTADLRTWLVRPTRSITGLVTRKVHGITNTDVADAPQWADIAQEITAAITGRVLVAHNASVERRVLQAHLPDWRPPLVLDTLRLAKAVWPDLPGGYALDRLIAHADLAAPSDDIGQPARRHRAAYDTWMTAALLRCLVAQGRLDWEHLVTAARLPEPATEMKEVGLW